MANCCGAPRCTCAVTAGPGVTVDGNGSPTTPYVISADSAAPTPLGVTDTPTVDLTLEGTGTAADPYNVHADVILDPAPPGGGAELLHTGPGGLYLECTDVRGCISAEGPATYDPATGVVGVQLSADPGNSTALGSDGGLFTPAPAAAEPTAVQAADTTTVDTTVTGTGTSADPYVVSAAVILDPAPPGGGTELLHTGPGGLYLECEDVRGCISAGDGASYDPGTGVVEARPSTDAGNSVSIGTDGGLFVPPASGGGTTAISVTDSTTVDLTLTGTGTAADPYDVTAAVILDPAPPGGGAELLHAGPGGLYLECADVRGCISAEGPATYDPATGVVGVQLSADPGNATVLGADGGIFTPAPAAAEPTAVQAADTPTVDTTVTGTGAAGDPYTVEADVIVAPAPNGLEAGASGLVVAPSADAGNLLEFGADGRLFVPPDPPLTVGCGLQGAGTAASPLAAFPVAAARDWTTDWDCDPAATSTLHCDPSTGALWTPPEHTSAAVTIQQNHPLGTPTVAAGAGFVIVDPDAWAEGTYTADSLTTCRGMTYSARFTGHVQLSWPANATFELGYALQINGGALAVRVLHGVYAAGPARQERYSFGVSQASVLPPHTGYAVRVYPAVHVIAGSVTFTQWLTDTDLIVVTR
jgi:hypothetical protein